MGENSLPDYCSVVSVNRPVRTRMPGGVGAGGEKPPATRLDPLLLRIFKYLHVKMLTNFNKYLGS
jgi:hypothetical protein